MKIFWLFSLFLFLSGTSNLPADPIFVDPPNQPPVVRIRATILDVKRRPITWATFEVYDLAHRPLESPDAMSYFCNSHGKVSYFVPKTTTYYIEASAPGYLMNEVKVNSSSSVIKVRFTLQKYPPPNKLHAIHAVIMDTQRHPIPWAVLLVFDTSRNNLQNPGHTEEADRNGKITMCVPIRKSYYVRGDASGYLWTEIKVPYNSQTMPIVLRKCKVRLQEN